MNKHLKVLVHLPSAPRSPFPLFPPLFSPVYFYSSSIAKSASFSQGQEDIREFYSDETHGMEAISGHGAVS